MNEPSPQCIQHGTDSSNSHSDSRFPGLRTNTNQDLRQPPCALHNHNELKYRYSHFTDRLREVRESIQGHTSDNGDAKIQTRFVLDFLLPGDQGLCSSRVGSRSPPTAALLGNAALFRPPAQIHRCAAGAVCPPGPGRPLSSLLHGPPSRRELQLGQPFRPPRPIVPDLTHLGEGRRVPGWGTGGKLPAAQEARSVTAGSAKAYPATSPRALRSRSMRGRFTLLARQRRPRRLLRPL